MFYNDETIGIRESTVSIPSRQSIDINCLFFEKIITLMKEGGSLLDIGTGNGFVLSEIMKLKQFDYTLTGVDNSKEMVKLARENLPYDVTILEADNNCLPFENETFDIVTAKNVTVFSVSEIFRILKPNGYFVYREYGPGKGLIEVAELFDGRLIRSRSEIFYKVILRNGGFEIVSFNKYEVIREYSIEELIKVTKSYPFIKDYNDEDENLIREKFKRNIKITSDPFILVAQKQINHI